MTDLVKKAAVAYINAGLSVVPTGIDKIPRVKKWKNREKTIPSESTVEKDFSKNGMCVAIICGGVSGGLETIDFDFKAGYFDAWAQMVEEDAPGLIPRLVIQGTQNGGAHITYRCSKTKIPGSQKLAVKYLQVDPEAADDNGEHEYEAKKFRAIERAGKHYITPTYIETRGEGGYFLAYPSPGYEIRQGLYSKPPDISPEEREILIDAALALSDREPGDPVTGPKPEGPGQGDLSPGDDFNQRGNVEQLLVEAKWVKTERRSSCGTGIHWRRPGKKKGQSGTLFDSKTFYNFSSHGNPFEPNTSYSAFAVYAMLKHAGDYSAAAKALAGQGYGDKPRGNTEPRAEAAEPAKDEWDKPISLDEPDIPEIKPEMLPPAIAEIAGAVSDATETPFELPAMLAIATVAAAVQGKIIVEVQRGYFEPLNIWALVALESGSRKSAVQRELARPLIDWEKERREKMQGDIEADRVRKKTAEARAEHLKRKCSRTDCADERAEIEKEMLETLAGIPEKRKPPRVWTDDVTPEKLAELMADHNERMAILSSEGGIIDLIAGRYSNLPNLDLFLKGYSGDPVAVDRVTRETVFMTHPTLTIGISPQPIVIQTLIEKHGFKGRGFLSRWLYVLPKSNLGYRTNETRPVDEGVKARFNSTIKALLSLEPPGGDPTRAHILKISKEAHNDRARFVDHVEIEMREGRRFEHIRDWAGKLPGQAVRLAGLFHAAKYAHIGADGLPIEPDTLKMALNLATILAGHALAAFDLMGQTPDLECAKKILKWIRRELTRREDRAFTKRELHQALKGTYKKSDELNPGLRVLIDLGYIREAKNESPGPGRPSERYEINPKMEQK